MLLINNCKLSHNFDFSKIKEYCANYLKIPESSITNAFIYKKSVDARKKSDVSFSCTFSIEVTENEQKLADTFNNVISVNKKSYTLSENKIVSNKKIVIAGFGPAGIFAALTLAKRGLNPIVIERGSSSEARIDTVNSFFAGGALNPECNIQFGEGGAGTFSDGKLTTGIKDPRCKTVLNEFVGCGAPKDILYEGKPHIGTDILPTVVKNIREEIIKLGGKVLFDTKLCDIGIKGGKISSVTAENENGIKNLPCDYLILAIGHSARDTMTMLLNKNVMLCQKAFAVGARIEHQQALINTAQLGSFSRCPEFTPADYKLATHLKNGRGVYTFCMCPGGSVINASSEIGAVVTNGMSTRSRDGKNANSALLVGVEPADFNSDSPLGGMYFQQKIECKAYEISGGYSLPAQTVGDFFKHKPSKGAGAIKPSTSPGVHFCDIRKILPQFVTDAMADGIKIFDNKLHGFASDDALLTAPETRSSSPVRIIRNDKYESNIMGLIPCGEGAGYAGGIISAAVDGIRCAESISERITE